VTLRKQSTRSPSQNRAKGQELKFWWRNRWDSPIKPDNWPQEPLTPIKAERKEALRFSATPEQYFEATLIRGQ